MKLRNLQYAPNLPDEITHVAVESVLLFESTVRPSDAVHDDVLIVSTGLDNDISGSQLMTSCRTAVVVFVSLTKLMYHASVFLLLRRGGVLLR